MWQHCAEKKGVRFQVLEGDMEPEQMDIIRDLESLLSWAEKCYSTIEVGKRLPLGQIQPIMI